MPTNPPTTIDGFLDEIDLLVGTIRTSVSGQQTAEHSAKIVALLNDFSKGAGTARDAIHTLSSMSTDATTTGQGPLSSMSTDGTTAHDGAFSSMSTDGCLKIIDSLVSAIRTAAAGRLSPDQSAKILPLLSNLAQAAQDTLDGIKKA